MQRCPFIFERKVSGRSRTIIDVWFACSLNWCVMCGSFCVEIRCPWLNPFLLGRHQGPAHHSEAETSRKRGLGGAQRLTLGYCPPTPQREGGARRDRERPGSRVLLHTAHPASFWFFPLSSHRHLGPGAWDLSARCLVVLLVCGLSCLESHHAYSKPLVSHGIVDKTSHDAQESAWQSQR